MSFAADIGKMVCEGQKTQMSEASATILVRLLSIGDKPVEEHTALFNDLICGMPLLRITANRFGLHFSKDVEVSPLLLIWIAMLSDSPGDVVLFLAALAYLHEAGQPLTITSLIRNHFDVGVPSRDTLARAWMMQKHSASIARSLGINTDFSDNLLDYNEAWI